MSGRNLVFSAIALFILRVGIILLGGQPEAPGGDQFAFYSGAKQLTYSTSEWLQGGGEFGYRAPMYFIYLAAIFELFPNSTFSTGQIATAITGVLNCVLMFLLSRNLIGDRGSKWIFWLRGVLPSFVVADTFVMSEPLFATFLLSALIAISSKPNTPDERQALTLGFFVACSVLTREVAILYPIIFGGYLLLASRSPQEGMRYVALFVIGIVIMLTPWMCRNVLVWGQPLPISYTSGVNLHIGNNPQATGRWIRFSDEMEKPDLGFGTPQSDAWHRKEALRYITTDPIHFVKLGFKKVAWFLWPRFEREEIKEVYKLQSKQATLVSVLLGSLNAIVMIVGIIGFVFSKHDWLWWISLALILYTMSVSFVVYGSPRYRDTIDYLLLIFAVNIWTRWRLLWIELETRGSLARRQAWVLVPILSYILGNWLWIAHDLAYPGH